MSKNNIFRRAHRLLVKKEAGTQLTEKEERLLSTALIPLMVRSNGVFREGITLREGLEELAKIAEEAKQNGAVPRRDQVRAVSHMR